jgi:hypothetical protein
LGENSDKKYTTGNLEDVYESTAMIQPKLAFAGLPSVIGEEAEIAIPCCHS